MTQAQPTIPRVTLLSSDFAIQSMHYSIPLMTRAGTPPKTTFSGNDFVTTAPAPTTTPFPRVTPLLNKQLIFAF